MNAASIDLELRADRVTFFSNADEKSFFDWLDGLSFVRRYEGHGRTLHIFVSPEEVDEAALRELIALFYRYNIDLRQLAVFNRADFDHWFRNKRAYWYERVFGQIENVS